MLNKLAKPLDASNSAGPFVYLQQIMAVAESDLRKLVHDPVELLTRMVQPALWLLVFGQVFARTRAIPTGNLGYLDFMAPGILAQSVLFGAIFYGISLSWERDLGIVHKFLVSPAPRTALVLAGPSLHRSGEFARHLWSTSSPSSSASGSDSSGMRSSVQLRSCRWPPQRSPLFH